MENLQLKAFTQSQQKKGDKRKVADCVCSCGKEIEVPISHLHTGHTKSCGHLKNKPSSRRKDLTGKKYGELTVTEMLFKYNYKNDGKLITCTRCKCSCGKEIVVPAAYLTSGKVKSCGCYRKKIMRDSHRKDLTGMRFGKLCVKEMIWGSRENETRTLARCLCDCGNEKIVPASQLLCDKHLHADAWANRMENIL